MSRFWLNETICHLIWIIWISKWDSEIIFVQSIEALKMNIELTLFRDYSMEDLTFRMDVEVYMKCFTDKTLWFIELKRADYEAWGWVWACQRLSALLHWLQHCIKKRIWKPTSKVISKLNFCFSFTLNERVHTHTRWNGKKRNRLTQIQSTWVLLVGKWVFVVFHLFRWTLFTTRLHDVFFFIRSDDCVDEWICTDLSCFFALFLSHLLRFSVALLSASTLYVYFSKMLVDVVKQSNSCWQE